MRVCFFGTYREEYSRNRIMLAALRSAGIEVVECHEPLWHSIEDRVQVVSGGWLKPKFWLRVLRAYCRLLRKHRQAGGYDLLLVGYPGHLDVFLARVLTRSKKVPLVWDVLMSLYLVSIERKLHQKHQISVSLLKWVEKKSLNKADLMLIESRYYAQWIKETYGVPIERFAYLPLGVDEAVFDPAKCQTLPFGRVPLKVLYYGGFLPSHGVEVIVQAARLLAEDPTFQFELAGTGPLLEKARSETQGLPNISFFGFLSQGELLERICAADICLGVFGQTPQALMTVQNKLFEPLAMGKCVLSGDSLAVRDLFRDEEEIWLCERTPTGLALALKKLAAEPELRQALGQNAAKRVGQDYSLQNLGLQLKAILESAISTPASAQANAVTGRERNQ